MGTLKEIEAPGLEEVMELIRFPRWEFSVRSDQVGILAVPGGTFSIAAPNRMRAQVEALRAAHEAEVESYRSRLFMVLAMFELGGDLLAKNDDISTEEKAEFATFADELLGNLGKVARNIVVSGPGLFDEAVKVHVKAKEKANHEDTKAHDEGKPEEV